MTSTNAIVRASIGAAVDRALDESALPATEFDKRVVAKQVLEEVGPVVLNQTNNEPWFQSRVTLGSLAAIVTSAFTLYAMLSAGITDGELLAPPIGAVLGGALSLYGRWKARKPIGS